MTQDPVDQMALDGPVETLEVIDLQLIRKALTEAQGEPTEAARARAFIAALSALLRNRYLSGVLARPNIRQSLSHAGG